MKNNFFKKNRGQVDGNEYLNQLKNDLNYLENQREDILECMNQCDTYDGIPLINQQDIFRKESIEQEISDLRKEIKKVQEAIKKGRFEEEFNKSYEYMIIKFKKSGDIVGINTMPSKMYKSFEGKINVNGKVHEVELIHCSKESPVFKALIEMEETIKKGSVVNYNVNNEQVEIIYLNKVTIEK